MRRFNDKTAKRLGKKEFTTNIFSPELYETWKKDNPTFCLSYIEFKTLWTAITDKIQDAVSSNPQGVKLAFHTGELIVQYLPKGLKAQDENSSNQIGEVVPHLNITTKGKVAKISWIRKGACRFNPPIMLYGFQHTREIALKANKNLIERPEIFRNSNIKIHDNSGNDI